ncbi:hypothetical protein PTT_05750 [Pyrenophora teres f. teres 0-1]|uniref:Uncharacterized protein n=1 Tax=Pyrenophora teres f. teres (strain 0-1) TaxID=861557 RepID=E3RF70_PYRTT|nr:hypothetical protein PTT_05750 [Pyrenophora teres f. teres 0-1]
MKHSYDKPSDSYLGMQTCRPSNYRRFRYLELAVRLDWQDSNDRLGKTLLALALTAPIADFVGSAGSIDFIRSVVSVGAVGWHNVGKVEGPLTKGY